MLTTTHDILSEVNK